MLFAYKLMPSSYLSKIKYQPSAPFLPNTCAYADGSASTLRCRPCSLFAGTDVALSLGLTESIFRQHILAAYIGLQRLESLNRLCLVTLQINQPNNQPLLYEFLNVTNYKPNHKMHKSNIIAFIEVCMVSFVVLYVRNSAEFTFVHCKL